MQWSTRFIAGFVLAAVGAFPTAHSAAASPPDRPWIEQVERDRDRGDGRVVDRPTWEVRRLREAGDVRLERVRPRREFERLDEERDRRTRLDSLWRGRRTPPDGERGGQSVILNESPGAAGAVMSAMALQAAADERTLAQAKEDFERSVRAVDVAEQRSLRTLRRRLNRERRGAEFDSEAASVRGRYERLRAAHRANYGRIRSRILGRK